MFDELLFDETLLDDTLYRSPDIRVEMRELEDDYWDEWDLAEDPADAEDPWSELHVAV